MKKILKVGRKSGLKYFSYDDIKGWGPCYDPIKHVSKGWRGTAIDVLNMGAVPFADRLWVVLRSEIVSERVMRLFAIWCYRQTLKFVTNPDPRSVAAADVAERFANGHATAEELEAAKSAAEAADAAAWAAVKSASWFCWASAAPRVSAEESAAWAAWSSANAAAKLGTPASTWLVAASSTWLMAESAAKSRSLMGYLVELARSAARSNQKDKLIEMILAESKERKKGGANERKW